MLPCDILITVEPKRQSGDFPPSTDLTEQLPRHPNGHRSTRDVTTSTSSPDVLKIPIRSLLDALRRPDRAGGQLLNRRLWTPGPPPAPARPPGKPGSAQRGPRPAGRRSGRRCGPTGGRRKPQAEAGTRGRPSSSQTGAGGGNLAGETRTHGAARRPRHRRAGPLKHSKAQPVKTHGLTRRPAPAAGAASRPSRALLAPTESSPGTGPDHPARTQRGPERAPRSLTSPHRPARPGPAAPRPPTPLAPPRPPIGCRYAEGAGRCAHSTPGRWRSLPPLRRRAPVCQGGGYRPSPGLGSLPRIPVFPTPAAPSAPGTPPAPAVVVSRRAGARLPLAPGTALHPRVAGRTRSERRDEEPRAPKQRGWCGPVRGLAAVLLLPGFTGRRQSRALAAHPREAAPTSPGY